MRKKSLCKKGKKKKLPCVLEEVDYQLGDTDKALDKLRLALPSGKRMSKEGNIYWELRANRSDVSKKKKI